MLWRGSIDYHHHAPEEPRHAYLLARKNTGNNPASAPEHYDWLSGALSHSRPNMPKIKHYLRSCRELTRFCSCDGCIDQDSLRYTIIMETSNEIVIDVEFEELLMDGPATPGGRIRCFGQLHLFLDQFGHVTRTEVL